MGKGTSILLSRGGEEHQVLGNTLSSCPVVDRHCPSRTAAFGDFPYQNFRAYFFFGLYWLQHIPSLPPLPRSFCLSISRVELRWQVPTSSAGSRGCRKNIRAVGRLPAAKCYMSRSDDGATYGDRKVLKVQVIQATSGIENNHPLRSPPPSSLLFAFQALYFCISGRRYSSISPS